MITNARYIITKESDDGTFLVGDTIWMDEEGCALSLDCEGWIDKNDLQEAMKGVELKFDEEYKMTKIKKLEEKLQAAKEWK